MTAASAPAGGPAPASTAPSGTTGSRGRRGSGGGARRAVRRLFTVSALGRAVVLVVATLLTLGPVLWTVSTSLRPVTESLQKSFHQMPHVHDLALGHPPARLQSGKIEEIVHEVLEAEGIGSNRPQEIPAKILGRIVFEEGFRKPPHGGEWGLQLVRRVGDEVPAYHFQPPNLGDIQEGDHRSAPFHRTS